MIAAAAIAAAAIDVAAVAENDHRDESPRFSLLLLDVMMLRLVKQTALDRAAIVVATRGI